MAIAQAIAALIDRLDPTSAAAASQTAMDILLLSNSRREYDLIGVTDLIVTLERRLDPKVSRAAYMRFGTDIANLLVDSPSNYFVFSPLVADLKSICAKLGPADAVPLLEGAISRWVKQGSRTPDSLGILADCLADAADHLPAADAERVCRPQLERVLATLNRSAGGRGAGERELSQGLAALARKIPPKDATDLICEALAKPRHPDVLPPLATALKMHCANLPAPQAMTPLSRVMNVKSTTEALGADQREFLGAVDTLTEAWAEAAGRLEPREAATILIRQMAGTRTGYSQEVVGLRLTQVARRLPDREAAAVLVSATEKLRSFPRALGPLTVTLATVSERLEPSERTAICRKGVAAVLANLSATRPSEQLPYAALAEGLAALLDRLEPDESLAKRRQVVKSLSALMSSANRPETVGQIATAVGVLLDRLDPDEGRESATAVVRTISDRLVRANTYEYLYLAWGLATLSPWLDRDSAIDCYRLIGDRIVKKIATEQDRNLSPLVVLTAGLTTDSHRDPRTITQYCQVIGSASGSLDLLCAVATMTNAPQSTLLSTQDLVDLLKHPLCVEKARQVVLKLLEDRYKKRFSAHWDFETYAREQGLALDFKSPPRRAQYVKPPGLVR
jgi:hypothetical protein